MSNMRILPLCLALLISSTAYAADKVDENIFKADLANSDLSLAVNAFEQTCLSFVLHSTELSRDQDKVYFRDRLSDQGFVFYSDDEHKTRRYMVEPARGKRVCEPISEGSNYYRFTNSNHVTNQSPVWTKPHEQFSVFKGREGPKDTHYHGPNENGYYSGVIPAKYKAFRTQIDVFRYDQDDRLTASLEWNYVNQDFPGKSCAIKLTEASFDKASFTENFIVKDEDWQRGAEGWSQCVESDAGKFLFNVSHHAGALSLYLTRNDFFDDALCGEAIK